MARGFGELAIKHGQLVHVILGRHLAQKIGGAEREADNLLEFALERNAIQRSIHTGAGNHVLNRANVLGRETLPCQKFRRKGRAPVHVYHGILRTGALGIVAALEIAGVMKENGDEPELEHFFRQDGLHPGVMPPFQQPDHA